MLNEEIPMSPSWSCHIEVPVNHSSVTKYCPPPCKSAIVTFSQRPVVKTTDLFIRGHPPQPGPSVNSAQSAVLVGDSMSP